VAMGRPILGIIRTAFNEVSAKSTNWASFIKYNANEAFTIAGAVATLVPDNMTFSKGTLVNPSDLALTSITGRTALANWTDNSSVSGNSASDEACFAFVTAAGECYSINTGSTRGDESAQEDIPGATATGNFSVFLFFVNAGNRKSGDSVLIS